MVFMGKVNVSEFVEERNREEKDYYGEWRGKGGRQQL